MDEKVGFVVLGIVIGIVICCVVGALFKNHFFRRVFDKLEYAIMFLSGSLLLIGIVLDGISTARTLSITYLNVFTSIIFSWLLTKWSTKKDYDEQERELAKISYRHIQHTEASVTTLIAEIKNFLTNNRKKEQSDTINVDPVEELKNVLSTLEYLKGGICANKQDWLDKLEESSDKVNTKAPLVDDEKLRDRLSNINIDENQDIA